MGALSKVGYVVMGIALVVAGFAALLRYGGDAPAKDNASLWVLWVALGIGLLPLPLQARRDPSSAAMFSVVFALIGILPGLITLLMGQSSSRALGLTLVCAAVFAVGLTHLLRSQYGKQALPNLLAQQFGKPAILEYEGVQFVAIAPSGVRVGEVFSLELYLQSCWNAPRTFGLELKGPHFVQLHPQPRVELKPLEVGVMTVPCVIGIGAVSGQLQLAADPLVLGSGGARVRAWRGHAVERKVSGGMQIAALAGGMLVTGGGLTWKFQIQPGTATATAALPPVGWKSVWPTAEDGAAALRPVGT